MRLLAIFAGVLGAVSLSQFPEFSQQYLQRLAGKVEALSLVTSQFDAAASASGLSRDGALRQLTGTEVLDRHQADLRADFDLQARLLADLEALRAATPLARLAMPRAFNDAETLQATYADYRPAMPTTAEGAITAGIGYVLAYGIVAFLWRVVSAPFRRRATS